MRLGHVAQRGGLRSQPAAGTEHASRPRSEPRLSVAVNPGSVCRNPRGQPGGVAVLPKAPGREAAWCWVWMGL